MSFRFIRDHAGRWPIRLMCRVLEVSASGYYAWRNRPDSARVVANRALLADVRRLHAEHHGRYGGPRMHAALRAEGRMASRGRVARLMRRNGIRALAGRRFKPCTTDSRHRDCQEFRVGPGIVGSKEPRYAATQRTEDS
jgi:putative transposase